MTERSQRIHFDELMRMLTVTGFAALAMWAGASSIGVISGYVAVSAPATLRFLLAVSILVFARRTYWELREWHWRKLPPDERFGFTNPLGARSRRAGREARAASIDEAGELGSAATGSSPPPA